MNAQSSPAAAAPARQYILTLSCPDKAGIVHAVSSYLFMTGCNIEDSQQFGDHDTGLFFMRVHFSAEEPVTVDKLRASFAAIGDSFHMDWQINRADERTRETPFIMVANESAEGDLSEADARASSTIVKPFTAQALKSKLVPVIGAF